MVQKSKKTSKNNGVNLKDTLLLKTLPHVATHGFTEEALLAGARAAKIAPSAALGMFPDLPADLIRQLADWADRAMLAGYAKHSKGVKRVRDKVALGVRLRLEALTPYKDAVQAEVRELAKPWQVPLAAQLIYVSCDAIWTAAGDTSDDYNYYTKRGLLAGVLTATTLRWLTDDSEDSAQTWAFLDRRIENVLKIGQFTSKLKESPSGLAASLASGLSQAACKVREKVRTRA